MIFVFQALDKKGIGHLGEKELKERNKQIQEENRRELQKAGKKCLNNLMLQCFGVHSKRLTCTGETAASREGTRKGHERDRARDAPEGKGGRTF